MIRIPEQRTNSNVVWSAAEGWHDGPEAVTALDNRGRLTVTRQTLCGCGVPGCSGTGAD